MKSWKSMGMGIVIGSVLTAGVFFGITCKWPQGLHNVSREKHFLSLLTRKLKLSPDQKISIEKILDKRRDEMKALHDEVRPKFEALRAATSQEISLILTDEQKIKFHELEIKMKQRMEKMRPPHD